MLRRGPVLQGRQGCPGLMDPSLRWDDGEERIRSLQV
jgi:hypothetical protein